MLFGKQVLSLSRILRERIGIVSIGLFAMFMGIASVEAHVCLLPGGQCNGETDPDHGGSSETCDGYNLTEVKCLGEACEVGWDCDECTNASGTHYKCEKKPTPAGYTAGLEECTTPCEAYTWNGFTGTQINGRCDPIPYADATPTDPGNPEDKCFSYIKPDYIYKVTISGADVTNVSRHDCYANIVEMTGYTINRPESCTIYSSRYDGLGGTAADNEDTMCFTAGESIGTFYSTEHDDLTVFTEESDYGKDNGVNTEQCFRVNGCNASRGWEPRSAFDGTDNGTLISQIFGFDTRLSKDGQYSCSHADYCRNDNGWYNYDTLGKYTDIFFTTRMATRISGTTCYKVTGCGANAYAEKPDTTYFKVEGRNSDGSLNNVNPTCWIVTGKADYAYTSEELPKYFSYSHKTAHQYNSSTGKFEDKTYYRIESCMGYAYASEPDAKHFTYNSQTRKKQGSNTNITCWNVTGKGTYAYLANEKLTDYFAYDDPGAWAYVGGTQTTVTSFNATGCAAGKAVLASGKNTAYLTYDGGQTQKFGGVNNPQTCYRATGCYASGGALPTSSKDETRFTYDAGAALSGYSCVKATGCATNVILAGSRNTTYLTFDGGATQSGYTCHKVTGCNTTGGALPAGNKDTSRFTYDAGATQGGVSCVKATGCATNVIPAASRNLSGFTYDGGATQSGHTCHKITGCAVTDQRPGACKNYTERTQGGRTCFYAIGNTCTGCQTSAPSCATWTTTKDTNQNTVYCNISAAFGTSCVTAGNRLSCYNYTAKKDTNGTWWYYNPSIMIAGATSQKPAVTNNDCHTFNYGTPSSNGNGVTCYYNIAAAVAQNPDTSKTIDNEVSGSCTCSQACSQSTSCTCTASCSGTSSCGCDGSQSYSGTKTGSGTKSCSGTQTRNGTRFHDVNYTRSRSCDGNGGGYVYGDWTKSSDGAWEACQCSGDWSNCCTYGACTCSSYGSCNVTWTGSCTGESDYFITSRSCGCNGTQEYTCLSGWGSCYSGSCCSGTECNIDGTKTCCAHGCLTHTAGNVTCGECSSTSDCKSWETDKVKYSCVSHECKGSWK